MDESVLPKRIPCLIDLRVDAQDNQLILGGPELSTNSAFGGSGNRFVDKKVGGLSTDGRPPNVTPQIQGPKKRKKSLFGRTPTDF